MPERSKESGLSIREAAHAEVEDLAEALGHTNERLERTMKRVPLLDNLADWRLVLLAGMVALVVAGVVRLLSAWLISVAVFLVVFAAVMLVIAGRRTGD